MLRATTTEEHREQLEGDLEGVEMDITKTLSLLEELENEILQLEKKIQELDNQFQIDVEEKAKHRKQSE